MSEVNEYPLGGDLTDERVSGMLHTTLERLARRVSQQNFQLFQIQANGSGALGEQVKSPYGSDWRDIGQGTDCKVMDMSFGDFDSTWRLNSPGCGGTSSVTRDKYKAPKRPGAPAPFPWPPGPIPPGPPGKPGPPGPGCPCGGHKGRQAVPPKEGGGGGGGRGFRWGVAMGSPAYQQGLVNRIPTGDRAGEIECQIGALSFRPSVLLAAASVPATTYIQGQIRGRLPGASYKTIKWGPQGVSLDLRAKSVWATPSEGAGKKVFMYTGLQQPNCSEYDTYASEATTYETENAPSSWSPWDGIVAAGTAKSQQYDPQQHPGLALGPDWRGGDLFIMDVKIYTDGDVGHTLSELELAVGELILDVNYA